MSVFLQDHLTAIDDNRLDTSSDTVDMSSEGLRSINFIINDLKGKHKWPFTVQRSLLKYYVGIREYSLPSNYDGLIGLYEQQNFTDPFELFSPLEFERSMNLSRSENIVAEEMISRDKMLKINFVNTKSRILEVELNTSATGWVGTGTASNVETDTYVYFNDTASVRFDLTGVGVGILTKTITSIDLSSLGRDYGMFQKFFTPLLPSGLTNAILRWGSSPTDYFEVTVTTQFNGKTFEEMNTVNFDYSSAAQTGTVNTSAIDYIQLQFTHTATIKNCRLSGLKAISPDPLIIENYTTDWATTDGTWGSVFGDINHAATDYGAWSGQFDWFGNVVEIGASWKVLNKMQEDTRAQNFKFEYQGIDQEGGLGGLVGQAIKKLPSRLKKRNAPMIILDGSSQRDYYA